MTRDLSIRLHELRAVLAKRMPSVVDATIVLLESVPPARDVARSGRYEVQYPIGTGGHAEVFLAVVQGADGFRRPVAIKRVRSDLANPGAFVAMLIEEAHQTARLAHPNVVSVLDFDRDPQGRPYLVMEYVDGVDLGTLIGTGPLPHSVVIFIVRELLAGLGYIHELRAQGRGRLGGLVHRDVKPSNVLLSWEGAVKLADFGLARMLQRRMAVGAHAGEGTPGYMSPEQARREALDGRADLYAVGIVLWELLAAQRLRVGWAGDARAATSFHAIRRPSEHRQGIPADLEAVAMRLLAYDREERYQTAEPTAHDLMCCQDAPRDGRGELARLLDERFPRSHRQDPLSRPPRLGPPSTRPRTVTDLPTPTNTPPHVPMEPGVASDDDTTPPPTVADPAATGWAINDPVVRFRVLGSERVFDLATSDRWVLGSSPECALHLDDPSGRVSRRHAVASREGEIWTMADLGSTNGLRVNGEERRSFQLAPGDEIKLGGITLIAESRRSMELHDLLRMWLGWSAPSLVEVDRALSKVREMANLHAALILRGAGSLVGVARRLHRVTLDDRPFVSLGPNDSGEQALDRAASGTLCVDARGLPRDIRAVLASLRTLDARVRLVACADSVEYVAELAAMISRIVTISIPPLTEREDEFERLLDAYGWDAVEELGASCLGFWPGDPELVRAIGIETLDEIEAVTRRLVALRNWGVTGGAERLQITHGALSRWARRRNIPT